MQPDYDSALFEVGKALERGRKRMDLSVEEISRKMDHQIRLLSDVWASYYMIDKSHYQRKSNFLLNYCK